MPPKKKPTGSNKGSTSGGGKVSDEHHRKQLKKLENPSLSSSSSSSSLQSSGSHGKPEASRPAVKAEPPKEVEGITRIHRSAPSQDIPKKIEPQPEKSILGHDAMVELVYKFCAGFLGIQKGIELINAASEEQPVCNPFQDRASLLKKGGSLNDCIENKLCEVEHIKDKDGQLNDAIVANQMQFLHRTETHDETTETLNRWKTEECNLHKPDGIKFFFVEAPKFLDGLLAEMKGAPPGVSRQLFQPWNPATIMYARESRGKGRAEQTSNPVYLWSRLTLEPILRHFFCLPEMSLNREANLWNDVVNDRFKKFWQVKDSLEKAVGYTVKHKKNIDRMGNCHDVKSEFFRFQEHPEEVLGDLKRKGRIGDYQESWGQIKNNLRPITEAKKAPSHLKDLLRIGEDLNQKNLEQKRLENLINKLCEIANRSMDEAINNLEGAIEIHQKKKQEAKSLQEEQDRLLAIHLAEEEGGRTYGEDDATQPLLGYDHASYGNFREM